MQRIDTNLLNGVTAQAKESPRLRMNHNFHGSLEAKAQRLLNALEPGTGITSTPASAYVGNLPAVAREDTGDVLQRCQGRNRIDCIGPSDG